MKLIVSSDGLTVVNAENIKSFSVDLSDDAMPVQADGIYLSYHSTVDGARKELNKMLSVLSCSDSFLYKAENSK